MIEFFFSFLWTDTWGDTTSTVYNGWRVQRTSSIPFQQLCWKCKTRAAHWFTTLQTSLWGWNPGGCEIMANISNKKYSVDQILEYNCKSMSFHNVHFYACCYNLLYQLYYLDQNKYFLSSVYLFNNKITYNKYICTRFLSCLYSWSCQTAVHGKQLQVTIFTMSTAAMIHV